eukprot:TRINITY_DN12095_c0_g5_i1.p1 TRINITY_DN12095_c0_g5~~TRINITY_DN12095_c0_g5_i1.p1  ORF type:complete len:416 (-),score=68.08 TRINITY_DN12095_c0_g5_i1:79-1326(-)
MVDGPPFALKIGPINCFCLWDGPSGDGQLSPCAPSLAPTQEKKQIHGPGRSLSREQSTQASSERSDAAHTERSSSSPGASAAVGVVTPAVGGRGAIGLRDDAEVRSGNQVDHPLMAAVRLQCGNLPSVQRELSLVEGVSISHGLSCIAHERLRRIVTQHRSAAQSAEWQVRESSSGTRGLEFGARVVDGMIQWFRCAEFRGCDVVKGFAALLEVDLGGAFSDELLAAEPLGVHTAKRDAIWRVVGESTFLNARRGSKPDTLWSYSAIDALDEPVGALVIFAYTPPESCYQASAAMSQNRRSDAMDLECVIHCIEPLWPEKDMRASSGGFRLWQTGMSKPAAAFSSPLTLMAAQGDMPKHELFHARLLKFLGAGKQLDQRMRTSPRTELYKRVQLHCEKLSLVASTKTQAAEAVAV